MDGAQTWAESRTDGVDFAIIVHTRDAAPLASVRFTTLVSNVQAWLNGATV